MRLRSTRDNSFFYIDWWLHNHCNYSCSYCPDIIKNKSILLPDIDHCINVVSQINDHAKTINKKCFFNIVGGEVTEYKLFKDLVQEIKRLDGVVSLRTNASCELSLWREILNSIDSVNFEYHPEFTGHSHFLLVVAETIKKQKKVHIVFNMMPERWSETLAFIKTITDLWPHINIHKKLLFDDPAINKKVQNYQDDQLESLNSEDGPLIYEEDSKIIYTNYNSLVLSEKNKFYNNKCSIGVEQIIIDAWGRIAKGHCRAGGHIGRLGKTIKFDSLQTICPHDSCRNAFDIQATKFS